MMRTQIGLIALVLLLGAAVMYLTFGMVGALAGTASGLLRIGLVLGALWLALPQLSAFFTKTPKWILIGFVVGFVLLAFTKLLWWIPLVMLAIWFLWSRFGVNLLGSSAPSRAPRRPTRKA